MEGLPILGVISTWEERVYTLQELNAPMERLREYLQDPFGNAGNACQAPTPLSL